MFKKFFSKYQTEDLIGFAIGMIATVIYKLIVHAVWNLEDMFDVFFMGGATGAILIGFLYRHFYKKD